jgi:hypothetical protein
MQTAQPPWALTPCTRLPQLSGERKAYACNVVHIILSLRDRKREGGKEGRKEECRKEGQNIILRQTYLETCINKTSR